MTAALDVLTGWPSQLDELFGRISGEFARAEPRRQARKYLEGLLGGAKRKNGWQLAEQIGDARPWRTQRVLSHVLWDQDRVRDVCRAYVVEQLGRDGVLIVDETGFLKKGEHSVDVARQYSGTAGRIDNCQVGVFLAYATDRGHALIDRRLYLPEDWLDDAHRREGRVPADVAFATKPAMARAMIAQALDTGEPCGWVAADALYGSDKSLRVLLEQRGVPYVLAVRGNEVLNILTAVGTFRCERVEHVGDRDNARFQWNGHAERPLGYSQNALGGMIDGHALAVLKAKAFPQRHDTSRTAFAEPGADRTNSAMRAGQLPRSSCTAARS